MCSTTIGRHAPFPFHVISLHRELGSACFGSFPIQGVLCLARSWTHPLWAAITALADSWRCVRKEIADLHPDVILKYPYHISPLLRIGSAPFGNWRNSLLQPNVADKLKFIVTHSPFFVTLFCHPFSSRFFVTISMFSQFRKLRISRWGCRNLMIITNLESWNSQLSDFMFSVIVRFHHRR